jgi:hypothetical protein
MDRISSMTPLDRKQFTNSFDQALKQFVINLSSYVSTESGEWTIKGFIDVFKNIYTISSDTKIVSKILEIHLFPEILQFAEKNGYNIILADKQNWYPDLTFVHKERADVMFAVDLKTTFRRNNTTAGFTLGSHGAYFKERDKEKNIQFPYSKYTAHFCLGVIYTRVDMTAFPDTNIYHVHELDEDDSELVPSIGARKVTDVKNMKSITSVIRDFNFFAVEKWKIASDSQGSGNTANIGSINDIEDLKKGNGVFSQIGEEWFDEYWMNYGLVNMIKDGKSVKITNIWDFLSFKGREDLFSKVVTKGAKRRK